MDSEGHIVKKGREAFKTYSYEAGAKHVIHLPAKKHF